MSYVGDVVQLFNHMSVEDYLRGTRKPIYHYTSPRGMEGILGNSTLRFSDRYFLNDSSEGNYTLQLCKDNIDYLISDTTCPRLKKAVIDTCDSNMQVQQNGLFHVYVLSLSLDADSLCLWNYYTKNDSIQGYNLKFFPKQLKSALSPLLKDEYSSISIVGGQVLYSQQKQLKILKDIASKFVGLSASYDHRYVANAATLMVDKMMQVGAFFKKACFSIENEYRIVLNLHINEDNEYTVLNHAMQFNQKGKIKVPCVDIPFSPQALKGVWLSPTLTIGQVNEDLKRWLSGPFSHIKESDISYSDIPVRY